MGKALVVDSANQGSIARGEPTTIVVAGGVPYFVDSSNNITAIATVSALSAYVTAGAPDITISGLTTDGAPDPNADYIRTFDADAAATKKVLLGVAASPYYISTQGTTTGTSVSFAIPPWARKITMMFDNVSLTDNDVIAVQFGINSGVVTVGYTSTSVYLEDGNGGTAATNTNNSTTGFVILANAAGDAVTGHMIFTRVGSTNRWISSHTTMKGTAETEWGAGSVTLSGTLTTIYVSDGSGGGSFDGGQIGVMCE